ncbi:hypothetical protein EYZ11_007036 [Aspergillus tanneri]|uniref:Aflatoxin regulatory protein domain-containing protein n=1 Tax=Aspergillus tanneri TaxID=1220188 RepID=A0A4S3JE94_9EURO|nr:uncharacterized protein ATNIH1004_000045 [Aspergillus tanneri]KAA8651167.1 hypothetical protein ATNIH1004_000045 [Aspergillus tanneri]THC93480.1 hypothetical protein EYZ11_007036 [Aspergillus tanneri]
MHGNNSAQSLINRATEQVNKDVPAHFSLSPSSLLDFPPDLDLGLDFGSPQGEIGPPLEARNLQPAMDPGTMQSHHSSQPLALEAHRGRSDGRSEHEHQTELHRTSQGSYILSASTSTLVPPYSQASSTHSSRRLSLARNMIPKSLNCQEAQDEGNARLIDFDYQGGTALNTDREDTGADSGYGPSVTSRSQPTHCETQESYNMGQQTTNPIVDPVMTSWIRKLSDMNLELHQHKFSIPSTEIEQSMWTNTKSSGTSSAPNSIQHDQELAVDRTFKLSYQFTEILTDIFSRFKTHQGSTRPITAALALDQPSQLLVLSSYLCLVESYDKILQHIKIWTEIQFMMGVSSADGHFPIQLPSLAIGSFKLPTSSSTRPLVLMCIIEAMIMQIHNQVNEMITPANTRNGTARMSHTDGEQGTGDGGGLSGVAKVTLQAIRAKEESTMKLLHVAWRRALQCGVP